jgi:hypothetical protein
MGRFSIIRRPAHCNSPPHFTAVLLTSNKVVPVPSHRRRRFSEISQTAACSRNSKAGALSFLDVVTLNYCTLGLIEAGSSKVICGLIIGCAAKPDPGAHCESRRLQTTRATNPQTVQLFAPAVLPPASNCAIPSAAVPSRSAIAHPAQCSTHQPQYPPTVSICSSATNRSRTTTSLCSRTTDSGTNGMQQYQHQSRVAGSTNQVAHPPGAVNSTVPAPALVMDAFWSVQRMRSPTCNCFQHTLSCLGYLIPLECE